MFKVGDKVRFKEVYRTNNYIFKVVKSDGGEEILDNNGIFTITNVINEKRVSVDHPRMTVHLQNDLIELVPIKRIIKIV